MAAGEEQIADDPRGHDRTRRGDGNPEAPPRGPVTGASTAAWHRRR
jgi:hypothetical protein